VLLGFLWVTALAIARGRDLLAATMLLGLYSLFSAGLLLLLDAADVAFTEAAVGAGVSTVLILSTLRMVGRFERPQPRPQWLALGIVLVTAATLIYGTLDLPAFGVASNPVHHHVADRYLQQSATEIGIPNVVTSVLASYRGYDTLGETAVVFTALLAVLLLIGGRKPQPRPPTQSTPPRPPGGATVNDHLILRVVSKALIPLIVLFAFYVQFHGDFSPGGGFQAGVIFAAAILLHLLVFGLASTSRIVPAAVLKFTAALGLLIYGGVGVAALFAGGAYLDYNVLAADPVAGQHLGIFLVEAGVGLTVASAMILLAYAFNARGNPA